MEAVDPGGQTGWVNAIMALLHCSGSQTIPQAEIAIWHLPYVADISRTGCRRMN